MAKDKDEKDSNQDRPRPVMKMYLSIHWDTQGVNNPAPRIPGTPEAPQAYGMAVEIEVPESMERFIFPATTSSFDWGVVRARAEVELYMLMMNMALAVINNRRGA